MVVSCVSATFEQVRILYTFIIFLFVHYCILLNSLIYYIYYLYSFKFIVELISIIEVVNTLIRFVIQQNLKVQWGLRF
jgi:hypothetical protein